jgi:hypothetical protein
LVDKEPEPEQPIMESVIGTPTWELAVVKEEKVESTEVDNQDTGNTRLSEASEPDGTERLLEQSAGAEPSKRSKRSRERKAA